MPTSFFEKPIENAPIVKLNNGKECIPQHYLVYQHTLTSVQRIVYNIEFDIRYPVFVTENQGDIIIQIGIVGADNYKPSTNILLGGIEQKIVYGRKWRVEKELPTSEVIQTVFLALKIAREHEVRELFRLTLNGRTTTPFNNHHDLPLMSENSELLLRHVVQSHNEQLAQLKLLISAIEYDSATFELQRIDRVRDNLWLVDIKTINTDDVSLNEINEGMIISLMLTHLSFNEFCYGLIDKLISLSNDYVSETFTYKGFARFSQKVCVTAIADLSSVVRKDFKNSQSDVHYSMTQMNDDVDRTRVPILDNSELSNKIQNNLATFGELAGMPPHFQAK